MGKCSLQAAGSPLSGNYAENNKMNLKRLLYIVFVMTILLGRLPAQPSYATNSVLATGNWYKMGVTQEGMYKVDMALLSSLGMNTTGLSSASIRLYGNGGGMLPENNAEPRIDDLFENPVEMIDGGDGIFNGADYFIFYAAGPQRWLKDSVGQAFSHQKNLYGDTVYYYVTMNGTGKRLPSQINGGPSNRTVTGYDERYFHENDLVNLLNSGKEWYGEELTANFGGNSTKSFTVNWPGLITTQPVVLHTALAGRSVGVTSYFSIQLNGQALPTVTVPAVSGNFLDAYAMPVSTSNTVVVGQSSVTVAFTFNPGIAGSQGWINSFEIHGRRGLAVTGTEPLFFRDWQSVGNGAIADYKIANSGSAFAVWDITDPLQPVKMTTSVTGSQLSFTNNAARLREYVAFAKAHLLSPVSIGKIANQNLHSIASADLIIITHASLLAEARKLALFHLQQDGYQTVVATADQVFTEFSGGRPDPSALRDFVKMIFDKAGQAIQQQPKYLLLFGSASYDYKNRIAGNRNLVPGYESENSLDPLNTYTSDDFFGLLDDADDINRNNAAATIDMGIGRIPARDLAEAKMMVDKIIRYHAKESLGAWRNQTVYVADDGDQNLHLNDAETISANAHTANAFINQYKIYLDAYPVLSGSGGARYPAVNDAIVNQVFNGALIFNYSGHGSYQRLAEEAVLTQDELNRFNNPGKLPLFITASCDFAPHDDPFKNSLGAGILTGNSNGAIALLTTTRLVFAYSNKVINDNYLQIALKPEANGQYLTLGESVKRAKNFTAQNSGDVLNNRKFTLLGDPAMRLAFPALKLRLTAVNGHPITAADTLRALGKYSFEGIVTDAAGNPVNDFNGTLQPTVFDRAQTVKTLGNDAGSIVTDFKQQSGVLYKGKSTVSNGRFQFSFIVPKDINSRTGKARISLYADDGKNDANGVNDSLTTGGAGEGMLIDNTGPVIKAFLNDDQFKNGGLTHENPVLLVKLFDDLGISTSGNGIGHDITAVLDGNERKVMVLNDFYTALQDSYQEGQVLFQLPTLSEGKHSIRIKAWDVANQSGETTLDFTVVKRAVFQMANIRNFPNPFTSSTTIAFEHNRPGDNLGVTVSIYTLLGALVKQIRQVVNTDGTRNVQINWQGDDQSGSKLKKGIYIYKIVVVAGGSQAESTQQLIIL